jgi:hypothetical protein
MSPKPSTSLFCLIAQDSPVAVVFRKGPSKLVQILRWDLTNDRFERGQWFKGRIYERFCDLSPSGKYLVYWAGNHKEPYYDWTAVSRPPYLTALILWPNIGSDGGGMFSSDSRLQLVNPSLFRKAGEPRPIGFETLQWEGSASSELGYVFESRMYREGWNHLQRGEAARYREVATKGDMRRPFEPIDIMRKSNGSSHLEMRTLGRDEVGGPPYVVEYRVSDLDDRTKLDLQRADWADWDKNGDLLYAKSGCIFRFKADQIGTGVPIMLIDLTESSFEPLEAPEDFKHW